MGHTSQVGRLGNGYAPVADAKYFLSIANVSGRVSDGARVYVEVHEHE